MLTLAYVALGGAVGALARYGLSGWVHSFLPATFPWGTLVVNVLGCFLLGVAFRVLQVTTVSGELRGLVTIGMLGAFTTFSTFSFEALSLLQGGEWLRGGLYLGGSVLLGLVAMLAGLGLVSVALQH